MVRLIEKTESFADITTATQGQIYDVAEAKSICIQVDATVTTPSGATVVIEKSNDRVTFSTEGTPVSISADATYYVEDAEPTYRYFRIAFAISGGEIDTADCHILVKS